MKFAAESLDTIGFIARSIDDARADHRGADRQACRSRPHRSARRRASGSAARRSGRKRSRKPCTRSSTPPGSFAASGASVREIELPADFAGLFQAARETINNYERSKAMAAEWRGDAARLSERLRSAIERGVTMRHTDYVAALRLGESCRARLDQVFDGMRRAAGALHARRGAGGAWPHRRSRLPGDSGPSCTFRR